MEANEGSLNSMREVKDIMTKRSGKQINQPSSPTFHGEQVGSSKNKEQGNTSEDEAFKSQTKKYERIIIKYLLYKV